MHNPLKSALTGVALLAALGLAAAPSAHAQGLTLTFDQAATQFSGGIVAQAADVAASSFSLGWTFTVDSPVAVTALGFYDDNNTAATLIMPQTAMAQSHHVGIFDASGNLIVQAIVTHADSPYDAYNDAPGATGDGFQLVRYSTVLTGGPGLIPSITSALPSFVLTPGSYSIMGVTGSDYYTYGTNTFSMPAGSGVTYGQSAYYADGNTTSPTPPDTFGGYDHGFFGPDFRFTSVNIAGAPEPSEWAAIGFTGLGIGGLLLRARKRRLAAVGREATADETDKA